MSLSCVFVFKHKTAYEMRMSEWSSDVCSADLVVSSFVTARILGPCAFCVSMLRAVQMPSACVAWRRRKPGRSFNDHLPSSGRSEEHTSELQSLMRISYAVFCLKITNLKINHHSRHQRPITIDLEMLSYHPFKY